ncbi:type II toxin-antitoxin system RelE/ParE family toxin [Polynucleobacter acidiphobus]|uniref:type II toxin-antitoxin system RelE/ParE family toxin n=1 Tax=Polynucleobacter acidiphobus TaxID=556053 RepID=UPI000D3A488F|nr:type II toxin-antitoxin system RelE/ParE family toxin [Polynucleobacter acidiphobus]
MICSFNCSKTENLFASMNVRRFKQIERVARRKLLQIHAVTRLDDLKVPPGNHLEHLIGNRKGQCSIRINNQWRICFIWKSDGAYNVEIVDYHQ